MIHRHRRRHFFSWIAIAVVLPLLFVMAWVAIPKEHLIEYSTNVQAGIEVNQSLQGSARYLELQVLESLVSPGTLVYLGGKESSNTEKTPLLGQIHGAGNYRFQLPDHSDPGQQYVLLYDPFIKKITHRIQF